MAYVLVAEDDPDMALLVSHKLRQSDHEVRIVGDGEAALAVVRERLPDLLVLDWMMPRKNGLEVCFEVRADAATASVPILMLTAMAQERDVERAFAAGADDYLTKPFSPRELAARVSRLLARKGAASG